MHLQPPRARAPRARRALEAGAEQRLPPGAALEMAGRACNAAQQIQLADARGTGNSGFCNPGLTELDQWKLRRVAAGLASGWQGDPALTASRPADELFDFLADHRRWLRATRDQADRERSPLAVHADWLDTYVCALDELDLDAARPGSLDSSPGQQRRLLAVVCAPFRQLLARELAVAASDANATYGRQLVGPGIAAGFVENLIDRFELMMAWAVETDENVAFARWGLSRRRATPDDHATYYARAFSDAAGYHSFCLHFPVLARWLSVVTWLLCDAGRELIHRLARDAQEIGEQLFADPVVAFTAASLGKSDYHAGGRSVAIVDVELASGPSSFVYKPRCLAAEGAVQKLLGLLAQEEVIGFARRRIVSCDGYGYEERIPEGDTEVRTRAEAERFYEELGGMLAVFYVLGGSDLHFENVIVAGGHPFVCDCETVLAVPLPGEEPALGTVLDSVYRTGMLDWPLPSTADVFMRLSGCTGGEAYEIPFALPRLHDGAALAVHYETGVRVEPTAPNRLRLDGRLVEPREFEQAIVDGFCRVHNWFRRAPDADATVVSLFNGTEVRLVARSTQVYAQVLIAVRHPRCLTEPLEVDLTFARLGEAPLRWDREGVATAAEAHCLWQLDIPRFTARATGHELRDDRGVAIRVKLARSPLESACHRIAALTEEDCRRQVGYIRASLSLDEVHSPSFVATALDYANVVADELCRQLENPARHARWTYRTAGAEVDEIGGTLYYGSAGVALFLAYLDAIDPRAELRKAARAALEHALVNEPSGIGAFDGLAGEIYVLLHLHRLWGESALLDRAIERSERLDPLIAGDRAFDVLSGSAGVIAVMLALDQIAGTGLEIAHRSARHLLRHAHPIGKALYWPSPDPGEAGQGLTGFAHGAGGIGWALIVLGAATGEDAYLDAGRRAFTYERLHFDGERRDWCDLRPSVARHDGRPHFANAWCNGAPGIGLSRLGSWVATGRDDDTLLDEIYVALSSTLRNFGAAGNDTLCHGRSGNAELLLRFARQHDEPAFQLEANMHAQAHWRRVASAPDWPRIDDGHQPLTGLMVGIAGVGLHFLRLAHPDHVPSPLLLDPPPPEPRGR